MTTLIPVWNGSLDRQAQTFALSPYQGSSSLSPSSMPVYDAVPSKQRGQRHQRHDARLRMHIAGYTAAGWSALQIARRLHVATSTVYWIQGVQRAQRTQKEAL